jgi:hypothetical protein
VLRYLCDEADGLKEGKFDRIRKQLRVGANGSTVAAALGKLTARRDRSRIEIYRQLVVVGKTSVDSDFA